MTNEEATKVLVDSEKQADEFVYTERYIKARIYLHNPYPQNINGDIMALGYVKYDIEKDRFIPVVMAADREGRELIKKTSDLIDRKAIIENDDLVKMGTIKLKGVDLKGDVWLKLV